MADSGADFTVTSLPGAELRQVSVSEVDNNCYLLTDTSTGAQLLIDAADDAPTLLRMVEHGSPGDDLRLDLVVTTHQHWDHHRALKHVVEATGARTAAGEEDADALPVRVDDRLRHLDRVRVGDLVLDVVHLRGHTPGSVALAWTDGDGLVHLFTGDSLFPGGVGNTQGDPERFTSLLNDVETRLFDVYPDSTVVYPGHGKGTTLGTERPHLPEWRDRGW
ncbi:MAG TPA: MBL fold metallo-hydrolase [Actinomycetales bacterium]|nr:MBL fold metallo-hydrolase [Actinomycetales bacterium]